MNSKLLITLATLFFLIGGTYVAIQWAKGYRFDTKEQTVAGRGLFVANSQPEGASVYINGKLETATDDNLHLEPGEYDIRLEKDGYSTWQKLLTIEEELVTQTNARLFPSVPSLTALTLNGATDIHPSPDGQKIAFKIATGSAQTKYGIWVLNLAGNPLRFGSNSVQIVQDTNTLAFTKAQLFWAPNSNQLLTYFNDNQMYLLNANQANDPDELLNAAFQVDGLVRDWHEQLLLERQKRLAKLPKEMVEIATSSASLLYFSPNEEKMLYLATASATIPDHLIPALPAINSQPQSRTLTPGNLYVYDLKEDTNFEVLANAATPQALEAMIAKYTLAFSPHLNLPLDQASQSAMLAQLTASTISDKPLLDQLELVQAQYSPLYSHNHLQWFPDSAHLIVTNEDNLSIMDYDGTNQVATFSGPFAQHFAYPWPDGSKLLVLTSLTTNPDIVTNLYALGLE